MIRKLAFQLAQIKDSVVQENLRLLAEYLRSDPLSKAGFQFYEWDLTAAAYPHTFALAHRLDFVPKDVLVTSVTGGTATFNYAAFSRTTVSITASAATKIRAFLGAYGEGRLS